MYKRTEITVGICALLILGILVCAQNSQEQDNDATRLWVAGFKYYEDAEATEKINAPDSLKCYKESISCFREIQRQYPEWNSSLVEYRLKICENKIKSFQPDNEKSQPPARHGTLYSTTDNGMQARQSGDTAGSSDPIEGLKILKSENDEQRKKIIFLMSLIELAGGEKSILSEKNREMSTKLERTEEILLQARNENAGYLSDIENLKRKISETSEQKALADEKSRKIPKDSEKAAAWENQDHKSPFEKNIDFSTSSCMEKRTSGRQSKDRINKTSDSLKLNYVEKTSDFSLLNEFSCSECGRAICARKEFIDKKIACPFCKHSQRIPEGAKVVISWKCSCGKELSVDVVSAGKICVCPFCNRRGIVPMEMNKQ